MARPATFDHLVGKKKPLTKTLRVVLDPELAEEYEEARKVRDQAKARSEVLKDDTESAFQLLEAEQRLAELAQRLADEEAVVTFKFRGIGRAGYEALVDKHRPTGEQRLQAKTEGYTLLWNPDTFPAALVAACLVEPSLTADQVADLWEDPNWNQAELEVIINAAIEVNGTRRTVELGKDWKPTPSSEPRSGTA